MFISTDFRQLGTFVAHGKTVVSVAMASSIDGGRSPYAGRFDSWRWVKAGGLTSNTSTESALTTDGVRVGRRGRLG